LARSTRSDNTEDERGSGGGRRIAVGGGLAESFSWLLIYCSGGDPQALVDPQQQHSQVSQSRHLDPNAPRDEASKFVAVVLADTEERGTRCFGKWEANMKSRSWSSSVGPRLRSGKLIAPPDFRFLLSTFYFLLCFQCLSEFSSPAALSIRNTTS
jgi:predicted metalloprotease